MEDALKQLFTITGLLILIIVPFIVSIIANIFTPVIQKTPEKVTDIYKLYKLNNDKNKLLKELKELKIEYNLYLLCIKLKENSTIQEFTLVGFVAIRYFFEGFLYSIAALYLAIYVSEFFMQNPETVNKPLYEVKITLNLVLNAIQLLAALYSLKVATSKIFKAIELISILKYCFSFDELDNYLNNYLMEDSEFFSKFGKALESETKTGEDSESEIKTDEDSTGEIKTDES